MPFVQVASFTNVKMPVDLEIEVILLDGTKMKGQFAKPSLSVVGKGELGDIRITLRDIRTIGEFEFRNTRYPWEKEAKALDRSGAIKQRQECHSESDPSDWQIIDGDTVIKTKHVSIWDRYYADEHNGMRVVSGGWFSIGEFRTYKWPLRKGSVKGDVFLSDVQRFEILGSRTDGRPDVKITKKDGSITTATLDLLGKESVDADDMLVWDAPYGKEGISLLPLRKLTIERVGK